MSNPLTDLLAAARDAEVEVMWNPKWPEEDHPPFLTMDDGSTVVYSGRNYEGYALADEEDSADLTVAAIRRGLVAKGLLDYECLIVDGVYYVKVHTTAITVAKRGTGQTELAALTAALRQMKKGETNA